jgi:sRNA-binding carbon storage regulator CsrA
LSILLQELDSMSMTHLVLTRRLREKVNIYDPDGKLVARIKPVLVRGQSVKLSLECEATYVIVRDEIDTAAPPPAPLRHVA